MGIAPPGLVVPAPKLPSIPKYGLLSVIEPIELDDPHAWAGGVEYEQYLCTTVESFTDNCPPATGYTKSTETDWEFCHSDPFVIKSSYKCSTGGRSVEDAFQIAKQRLLAWESHELERALWTGITANGQINPSFAFGNDTCDIVPVDVSSSGPLGPIAAFAVIEEALSDVVPGGGVIHAPFGLASYLKRYGLIEKEGDVYYSPSGFPVVLGAGYPGSGLNNEVPTVGSTWIFGTGPLAVWRDQFFTNPSEVSEGIDRYRNNITVFAERFYAVGFSCALFAATVCL